MGNKGTKKDRVELQLKENLPSGDGVSLVSTDWRNDGEDKTEKPPLLDVDHLLRFTNSKVDYDPNPVKITVEKIPVPEGYLLHNVLTADECLQYIRISEEMGYETAPLRNLDTINATTFALDQSTLEIRNSLRVLFDASDDIGRVLNERILPYLPETIIIDDDEWCVQYMGGGVAKCPLNKRWRFNKYSVGQFFKPHFDSGYVYGTNEKTLLSLILYLNGGFSGGETTFYPGNKRRFNAPPELGIEFSVQPQAGTALIFVQTGSENPRHEGRPLTNFGEYKYILRTDVAYYRKYPI